jgi:hypothetical protein
MDGALDDSREKGDRRRNIEGGFMCRLGDRAPISNGGIGVEKLLASASSPFAGQRSPAAVVSRSFKLGGHMVRERRGLDLG